MFRLTLASLALALPTAAHAHVGDHHGLSWREALAHLLEPDHLAIAALAVIVGVMAWRWRRAALARQRHASRRPGERS